MNYAKRLTSNTSSQIFHGNSLERLFQAGWTTFQPSHCPKLQWQIHQRLGSIDCKSNVRVSLSIWNYILTQLGVVNIDIDCMDPAEASKLLPFVPHDQTSNQRLVYEQMVAPENQEMLLKTARELKDEGWEAIFIRIVCNDVSGALMIHSM
jgi:hypothetical protein